MSLKRIFSITFLGQLAILLLVSPEQVQCQTITTSVQTRIVNVTSWEGYNTVQPYYYDFETVYIDNVKILNKNITWSSSPYPFPFNPFPDGRVAYLHSIKSNDGGKTYMGQIVNTLSYGSSVPQNLYFPINPRGDWIGTMFSTICDHTPSECNGRSRSNIYFVQY